MTAVLREALSNVAHYSTATRTTITIRVSDTHVTLRIDDDAPHTLEPTAGDPTGSDLTHLQQRATALGGSTTLSHPPAAGTTLEWTCPRPPTPPE
jgi:signal transduction histidine kinase